LGADAVSFVWIPPLFLWSKGTPFIQLALAGFIAAGSFRLLRFLKHGLIDGAFVELPVTYTGYFWILGIFLIKLDWNSLVGICLLFLSSAMVSRQLRINPSL
jgi:phosphatidylserine synthase